MSKKPEIAGQYQAKRSAKGTFVKGFSGNPEGKPVGTKSFSTIWKEFIIKVAKDDKIKDIDDIEKQLLAVAFNRAKNGDYSFYKDIFDRVYGKAVQPTQEILDDVLVQKEIERANAEIDAWQRMWFNDEKKPTKKTTKKEVKKVTKKEVKKEVKKEPVKKVVKKQNGNSKVKPKSNRTNFIG